MQLSVVALLSLLPLLASAAHSSPRSGPRHAAHRRISETVERRAALAAEHPPALEKKRVVKKRSGASGCRPKTSLTFSPTSTATTATSTSSAVASTTSTSDAVTASTTASATTSDAAGVAAAWWQGSSSSSSSSNDDDASQSSTTTSSSSSAAAATSSAASTSSSGSLTPSSIKAGLSGGDALSDVGDHISWWYDWGNTGTGDTSAVYVPMLWGDGNSGASDDASRLASFKALDYSPQYILGFYEPDCSPPMSSAIDPDVAAPLWTSLIVPHRTNGGSLLLSPGMCKQKDEDWLTPFLKAIGDDNVWDITAIHINKNTIEGVKEDIDYYWNTYGKPIWVSEFACVDDSDGFVPSTDQDEINQFIKDVVPLFESDSRIYAYAYSNGEGLGTVWPMVVDGALTESGQTYISAISAYH